jgi:sugar (pentulose or hexulose) kinase
MPRIPVIAILDVGKTNKKLFFFDESYHILWEDSVVLAESKDEGGFPCEDLKMLKSWIGEVLARSKSVSEAEIRAINFTAYGASLVHISDSGPIAPLYNYLKPYPENIKKQFYDKYGGEDAFSIQTASPVLGSLNSGMQLYRIRNENPGLFAQIKYSLHLPQYLGWLVTRKVCSDITSIGCHTNLWNYSLDRYHEWVYREQIIDKLAPILSSDAVHSVNPRASEHFSARWSPECLSGIGLHDSSAAIIPYMENFPEPFVLISTGTWSISMNPFNSEPLTINELQNDCLCYLSYTGRTVKASRLFAGSEHELQTERMAEHFQKGKNFYQTVAYDARIISDLKSENKKQLFELIDLPAGVFAFGRRSLSGFKNFEEAYHRLMMDIMEQQQISTGRIISEKSAKKIFVDGGFSGNPVFMQLLANAFPSVEVFAASVPRASALGAAMTIHEHWNRRPIPTGLIELKSYEPDT